jgi:hypothetical protein
MDGQTAAREMAPFLVELRDVRNTLRRTLNSARDFEQKLTGPRPSNPDNSPPKSISSDSIRSLLVEVCIVSAQLEKVVEAQHAIVGGNDESKCDAPRAVGY